MRWVQRHFDFQAASRLVSEANISPLIATLLAARGITNSPEAHDFLNPSLEALYSPYEMLGMEAAVERLMAAIAKK